MKRKRTDPINANCALCGCYNRVWWTAGATPFCRGAVSCAKRIRADLLSGRKQLVALVK